VFVSLLSGCVSIEAEDASSDLKAKAHTYAGHCSAAFAMPAKSSWNNKISSKVVTAVGQPNHRIRDQFVAVVRGDSSVAEGTFAVWPKGVQVTVTDIDGTLTTSDWQAIQDVFFGIERRCTRMPTP